jgi:hypothetical protein
MANPGPTALIGTYQYLGESHNLQDTDETVVAMLPWTPAMLAQLRGRAARLGMMRPTLYTFLCAEGTIDERISSILVSKLPALEAMGEGAHGLHGIDNVLEGLQDMDGLISDALASFLQHDETDDDRGI